MRTILIILIALTNGCGYGQYPDTTYNGNAQTKDDSGKIFRVVKIHDSTRPYITYDDDTLRIFVDLEIIDSLYIDTTGGKRAITRVKQSSGAIQFDSAKIYYQRFNKYQRLMDAELEKINRLQNPQITRKIFRYQDSCNRYQELLSRIKNKIPFNKIQND